MKNYYLQTWWVRTFINFFVPQLPVWFVIVGIMLKGNPIAAMQLWYFWLAFIGITVLVSIASCADEYRRRKKRQAQNRLSWNIEHKA